jgi:NodT family efflux transporter outer membrane factor (OMF) lipoprotein
MKLPAQFNNTAVNDTVSVATINWKDFYTDVTLQELIERGIAYNHDLITAIQRIEITEQYVRQGKQLWLPEIELNISGGYVHPFKNGASASAGDYQNYTAGLDFTWEIDIWGKIRNRKKITLTEYLQSNEAKDAVQTRLIRNISAGYYNLLLLDRQLEITSRNLTLADSTLNMTILLYEEGEVTGISVQQIRAQRESIAVLLPRIQQGITLQENALQELMGQFPDKIARKENFDNQKIPDNLSVDLPVSLLSNRPDVRMVELDVHIANYKIGIARTNMYPSLFITAGEGLEALKASDWFNIPSSLFGMVAENLVQPLLLRRRLKTEYEVSKLERDQSITRFRQTVVSAVTDVSNTLTTIEKLKEQEEILQRQVSGLNGTVSNARLLYQEGMANYLEVMAAQNAALNAELNLYQVRYLSLVAASDLYRSLGGGKQ